MLKGWTLIGALVLAGCGDAGAQDPMKDVGGAGAQGHAIALNVTLKASGGKLAFLSPSNTVIEHPVSFAAGKPYLAAAFKAGFSPGNDAPLDYTWGTIPDSLTVRWVTRVPFADGPYDVVFVGYTATPITPAIQAGPPQSAPAAKGGDLASFTISTSDVRPGDPRNTLGTLRVNVAGADAALALENRTPQDPKDPAQGLAAFTNTVLTIP